MRTALVCSALRSGGSGGGGGGGAALAGAAENLRDLTTTMLVCYTDDVVVCSQSGMNSKNPPKMGYKKFVKLTGDNYDCINLTNFEYKARPMTEKG